MTLKEFKTTFKFGLTVDALKQLALEYPMTKVAAKLSMLHGDSRPVMTARRMLELSDALELSNYKKGHFREVWIV